MGKNLVIVESPAKAKTIEKFLGSDYTVASSFGHIRDLASNDLSVDVENNFEPNYEISADKKKVIAELKKLAKDAEDVWLATDEDREGEAISWHLAQALGLDVDKTKRIVFHEITKEAILKSIKNPRKIDKNLVDAQQARRVLDRLVGYELSPVLWKKVKPSLSAGRVQSVSVKLIVERERQVLDFKPKTSYKPKASFVTKGKEIDAELTQVIDDKTETEKLLNSCIDAKFEITNIQVKPTKRSPAPPFTTSTLQQEASRKLGYSVSKTMTIAQKLYESGKITYMRTDSVNISDLAVNTAKKEITSQYGEKYSKPRRYSTKSAGAQEAHEAIRPTYLQNHNEGASNDEKRLYELIWKRTIASQMAEAQLENTTIRIESDKSDYTFSAHGQQIKFDGFLKVYLESTDDEEEGKDTDSKLLPKVEEGDEMDLVSLICRQRFSRPPSRYTEASLVRKLEELGIGRPSTYAPTISTIQKRGYINKESRDGKLRKYHILELKDGKIIEREAEETYNNEKNKLFPSDIGIMVNDFLNEYFDTIMDYHFTANVEEEFDHIATGNMKWRKMLEKFYSPFHEKVEHTTKEAKRVNQERHLGEDPKTGKPILAKYGKYGPYVQLGPTPENDDDPKPKYAKIRQGQLIESIELEDALELFKLPRNLGTYEEKDVLVDIGRFGPYVRHNNKFTSIPKDEDPYEIGYDRAVELILEKREADKKKFINEFEHEGETIQILHGRWGPYIKKGRKNFKIPKETEAESLSLDETLEIIENQPTKTKKKRTTKSTKGSKTTKKKK